MRLKVKSTLILLIMFGAVVVLVPMLTANPGFTSGNNKDLPRSMGDLKGAVVSAPIYINSSWAAAKTAGIVTGNGTSSDPYIIEDLLINDPSSWYGILIEDSNAYFIIRNCTVFNQTDAGITLYNVTNGVLINNTLEEATRSGIYLVNSRNIIITGNTVKYHGREGIWLTGSNSNTISDNILNNNGQGMSCFAGSINNTISGNTVNNNRDDGIGLHTDCNNNTVTENAVNNNGDYGIGLHEANHNMITENIANGNEHDGIFAIDARYNTISGNTISNNRRAGIYLESCSYNTFSNNTLSANFEGIVEVSCTGNVFSDNTIIPAQTALDPPTSALSIALIGVSSFVIYKNHKVSKEIPEEVDL